MSLSKYQGIPCRKIKDFHPPLNPLPYINRGSMDVNPVHRELFSCWNLHMHMSLPTYKDLPFRDFVSKGHYEAFRASRICYP